MTTKEAISGAIKGRRDCQKFLYFSYADYLRTICRRYGYSDQDIQDILQESFLEIFNSLKSYDPDKAKFATWIRTITIRTALQFSKKNNRSNTELALDKRMPSIAPAAIAHLNEEDLLKIINSLPKGYREVFNLFIIDGYTHEEIANLLDIKASTSRSQLSRAKDHLKKMLSSTYKKLLML